MNEEYIHPIYGRSWTDWEMELHLRQMANNWVAKWALLGLCAPLLIGSFATLCYMSIQQLGG